MGVGRVGPAHPCCVLEQGVNERCSCGGGEDEEGGEQQQDDDERDEPEFSVLLHEAEEFRDQVALLLRCGPIPALGNAQGAGRQTLPGLPGKIKLTPEARISGKTSR